jgi:hypothetical protein
VPGVYKYFDSTTAQKEQISRLQRNNDLKSFTSLKNSNLLPFLLHRNKPQQAAEHVRAFARHLAYLKAAISIEMKNIICFLYFKHSN